MNDTVKQPFKMDKKKVLALVILILTLSTMVLYVQSKQGQRDNTIIETNPQFVISSWAFPDEYGQGIHQIQMFENSTGSWVVVDEYSHDDSNSLFNWTGGIAIKLRVYTWFNSTLTGASDNITGRNYQRHNVTVTDINDALVFSQQNFTYFYVNELDPPMWFYGYEVVLNFIPGFGQYYTVTVTYEVYY